MHKESQLRYTNEPFLNSRELVILLLIAAPLIHSVALFLCAHKLAPLSLHACFSALVFSLPCAHMVAPLLSFTFLLPFRSLLLPFDHLPAPLCSFDRSYACFPPLGPFLCFAALILSLRGARSLPSLRLFTRSVRCARCRLLSLSAERICLLARL